MNKEFMSTMRLLVTVTVLWSVECRSFLSLNGITSDSRLIRIGNYKDSSRVQFIFHFRPWMGISTAWILTFSPSENIHQKVKYGGPRGLQQFVDNLPNNGSIIMTFLLDNFNHSIYRKCSGISCQCIWRFLHVSFTSFVSIAMVVEYVVEHFSWLTR